MSSMSLPLAAGMQTAGRLSEEPFHILNAFPSELVMLDRWVNWKYVPVPGKPPTKPPFMPDGKHASHTDSATWSSCPEVFRVHNNNKEIGVGCVVAEPYCVVDIDHVIDDAGHVELWAQDIINEIGSYTEVSPGGYGIHIWFRGALPGPGR